MNSVLTYVTLNTNDFDNDCHFGFSFFEELTHIVAHEAVYSLLKFSIQDVDDYYGLCVGIMWAR